MQFSLLVIMSFSFSLAYANPHESKYSNSAKAEVLLDNIIASDLPQDLTCMDEYNQRRKQLKKWLLFTPPLGLVAAPVGGAVGGFAGAGIANLAGASGWSALGYAIGGMMLVGGGAAIATVGIEAVSIDKYIKTARMMEIIVDAHNQKLGKTTKRYLKRMNRHFGRSMGVERFQEIIVYLDESNLLCNGEITGDYKKLKHRLVLKKELLAYVAGMN